MARVIMTEPESITAVMGRSKGGGRRGETGEKVSIPRRCSVLESSFAAHVDGVENREFIEEVAPSVVVSLLLPPIRRPFVHPSAR